MSSWNKNQNASYTVLEKVPVKVVCKDVTRGYIHSSNSFVIIKKQE